MRKTFAGVWTARVTLVLAFLPGSAFCQSIPEPDLVLYGVIRVGANQRLTVGTLTWQFRSVLRTITVSTPVTNINDQFSYILRVPAESQVGSFLVSPNVLRLISTPTLYDRSQASIFVDASLPLTFANPAQTNVSLASKDRGKIERIDLVATGLMVDADGNGLPDFWERQYFGQFGVDPNDDYDLDGVSNLDEYKAGTNPADANSRFRFVNVISQFPSGVRVEWSSVEGTSYALQRTTALASEQVVWTTIQTRLPATAPQNTYLDTTAIGAGPYFYRLLVEP